MRISKKNSSVRLTARPPPYGSCGRNEPLCKRIEQQVPGIQQNLREFEENKSQNQKEAVRHEYQRRNR